MTDQTPTASGPPLRERLEAEADQLEAIIARCRAETIEDGHEPAVCADCEAAAKTAALLREAASFLDAEARAQEPTEFGKGRTR